MRSRTTSGTSQPTQDRQKRDALEQSVQRLDKRKLRIEQGAIAKMSSTDQRRTETHERQEVLDEKLHGHLTDSQKSRYEQVLFELRSLQSQIQQLPPAETVLALAQCDPTP